MSTLLTVGAVGGALAASAAWAVRGRASSVFGPSVWRGPRDRRALALTFDDGPSESTPEILEILERHKVTAAFFQCGANVERLPGIAREVASASHEIGNHSHTHPAFYLRSAGFIEEEMSRAQETIARHTGACPRWFRAPFGARWFGLRRAQRSLGLTGVMWTVIGYDWKLTAAGVADRITRGATNGAILCLHDGRELAVRPDLGVTIQAVRSLLPILLDRGYEFESLSGLLCPTK